MSKSLYIGTLGPRSGKSLVLLGVLELLSRRVEKLGFFRPVIRSRDQRDNDIELVRSRYALDLPYESLYALTYEEVRQRVSDGQHEQLLQDVFARYKELERRCDFVVCEGSDFAGVSTALEFDFNARLANHLGCPVLIVASGRGRPPGDIVGFVRAAREAFDEEGCDVTATVVNRVAADEVGDVARALRESWSHDDPTWVVPEDSILENPTVREVVQALGGRLLHGDEAALSREVLDYKVAAMHLPNFLEHIDDGSVVIAPGDRADIILGCVAAALSERYPAIAGLVLTGGLEPAPQIRRLLEGLRTWTVPILSVDTDTYTTAMQAAAVPALITPENERKIALALGLFESHVDLEELEKRIEVFRSTRVTPLMFEYELLERAEANRKHIVLPEGTDERILRAAEILLRRRVVDITLLGSAREIREAAGALGLDLAEAKIENPVESRWLEDFAATYFELRKHKGVSEDAARDILTDVSYFGTMMVYKGLADGMVSGAAHTTAHTIRPSFEIIKTVPGCSIVSSVFLMCLSDRVLVYGDCAVNPEPTPEQLADIAASSAVTAEMFGIEPRVAMLSYSTGTSGSGEEVEKVREATRIARERHPELRIEGPIQYDAAVDADVARKKLPGSDVAGRATVFIFPDLNTGNNTYKAVQRSANAVAIGPVLQGLRKPVNDLSRGCTIPDIVNTVAITAIQAQAIEGGS